MSEHRGLCVGGPMDGEVLASAAQRIIVPDFRGPGPGIGQGVYTWHYAKGVWLYCFDETSKTEGEA